MIKCVLHWDQLQWLVGSNERIALSRAASSSVSVPSSSFFSSGIRRCATRASFCATCWSRTSPTKKSTDLRTAAGRDQRWKDDKLQWRWWAAGCWRTRLRPVRTWTRARLAAGARASSCRQRHRSHSWKNSNPERHGLTRSAGRRLRPGEGSAARRARATGGSRSAAATTPSCLRQPSASRVSAGRMLHGCWRRLGSQRYQIVRRTPCVVFRSPPCVPGAHHPRQGSDKHTHPPPS